MHTEYGSFGLFVLPGFREATSPGWDGRLRATLPAVHALTLSLDRARAAVDLGDGAVLRAPAINYQLTVQRARLQFSPRSLDVDVTPALGELERSALARALGDLLDHQLRDFWPEDQDGIAGADTLLVLGRDAPWGPLRVCVPTGGALALRLTHEGVAVTSAAGVLFVATKLDWLPSFRLRRLEYQFQSGAVAIDITGIEERFYKEDQDVSVVTEAILAHLIKLLVDPKIPDLALPLGFVRHEPPPALKPPFGRIKLFNHELSPTIGVLTLTMDPDDAITIGASGEEVSITTERGLQVHLPALRLQVELKRMRFHPVSGEVQLGGLGQLENAVVEAIIARKLAERRAGAGAAEAEAQAPIDVALASVPRDSDGRLVLYKSGPVDIKMDPSARFEITFAPTGIDFKADPPISIDGPGFLDAEVAGVRYNFADATFKIKLASDGVLPDFLSGKAVVSIEKKIAAVFAPLLPPIMRERGYSLADDIMPAETLAELIGALRRFGKQSPKP
ncbi:MAG: hypothetical protein KC636_39290, partial [Myxococcales bacterium]|nr:hypothetical protein [Myxococcales bacterium]